MKSHLLKLESDRHLGQSSKDFGFLVSDQRSNIQPIRYDALATLLAACVLVNAVEELIAGSWLQVLFCQLWPSSGLIIVLLFLPACLCLSNNRPHALYAIPLCTGCRRAKAGLNWCRQYPLARLHLRLHCERPLCSQH